MQYFVVYLYKGHMNVPIEGMFPYLVCVPLLYNKKIAT